MFPRKLKIQLDNEKKTASPFCKICYDAKQEGFNTHYVRDRPGGDVVCPYLLSLNCSYCHNSGHTVKYCDILKTKNQLPVKRKANGTFIQDHDGWNHRPSQAGKFLIVGLDEKPIQQAESSVSSNKFNPFAEGIAVEEGLAAQEEKFISDFPRLTLRDDDIITTHHSEVRSWADAVKKGSK